MNVQSAGQCKVPIDKDANKQHSAKQAISQDLAVNVSQFGKEWVQLIKQELFEFVHLKCTHFLTRIAHPLGRIALQFVVLNHGGKTDEWGE